MDDEALLSLIWRKHFPKDLQQHLAGIGSERLRPLRPLVLYFDDEGRCTGTPVVVGATLGHLLFDHHLANYLDALGWACAFTASLVREVQ